MDMESKPLKSKVELAMEKAEKLVEDENRAPVKTREEIVNAKVKLMEEEAAVQEKDMARIKEIAQEAGLDLSESIAVKEGKIAEIKQEETQILGAGKNKTLAEKNDEGMAKYFRKEESTVVKNYDQDGNESKEKELDLTTPEKRQAYINSQKSDYEKVAEEVDASKTLAEKNQEDINKYFSKEETTAVKNYDSNGKEIKAQEITEQPKVAEKTESVKQTASEKSKINEQIQTEALRDFTRGLKGKEKIEVGSKWEGDTIMQAMEDFVNSQKEKSPTAKAFGEMLSFVQKKSAEMIKSKIDKDAIKKAAEDFSKKSVKWATNIFDSLKSEMEKRAARKSDEALRIDEIMSGGNRSVGALRVDEAMGRANEAGKAEKNLANFENKIKLVDNPNDLMDLLGTIDGLKGSNGFNKAETQKDYVKRLFETGDKRWLNWLTRTAGLLENTERIFDSIHGNKKEEIKDAA